MSRFPHVFGVLAVLALLSAAPAAASGGQEPLFQDDVQLATNPAGTLQTLRLLGVRRVRVSVHWNSIAPAPNSRQEPNFDATDPGAYPAGNWSFYDTVLQDALADGIAVDFTITGPAPLWAVGRGDPGVNPQWRPSAPEFGAFVKALGTRYSGTYPAGSSTPLPRVDYWALWNEPNYGPDLAPQAINNSTVESSPALYRNLLDAAWTALQATSHSNDTILIGELAPRGITAPGFPGNFSGMVPLRFLRALYCVNSSYNPLRGTGARIRGCPPGAGGSAAFAQAHPALFHATGFADHPYPQGGPPNGATPNEPDYTDLPALPRLGRALDRLQRLYGSNTRFPIYSTEYGYRTNPPQPGATPPSRAAFYLNWGEYLSWRNPRLVTYMQYQLVDPFHGNFPTALEFTTGTRKPAYAAYRLPLFMPVTSTQRGRRLEVWGCARPAAFATIDAGAAAPIEIQFQRGSHGSFTTVKTVPITSVRGYFDLGVTFPASGSVRLAWSYPNGDTIHSRVQSIAVH